jgi:hypothetical protein
MGVTYFCLWCQERELKTIFFLQLFVTKFESSADLFWHNLVFETQKKNPPICVFSGLFLIFELIFGEQEEQVLFAWNI